jgi:polyisoprenyl-phosphate glycosyltransferase
MNNNQQPLSTIHNNVRLVILMPVFNDWSVADLLLQRIDTMLAQHGLTSNVLMIDDGSTEPIPHIFPSSRMTALRKLEIIQLRRNLGHQRALAVGLVHLHEINQYDAIVVMDADGEDSPNDIPSLLRQIAIHDYDKIVFVERAKRAEGRTFKTFYGLYRLLHRVLVGFDVRFGNFSIIPAHFVERLVVSSELWNHYAAAAVKIKLPIATLRLDRAQRLSGQSKMSLANLVLHGLSAMAVYSDMIGVRLMFVSGMLIGATLLLLGAVVALRLGTTVAIPGWATYVCGFLIVILLQIIMISLSLTFTILYSRGQATFIPVRDCPVYISGIRTKDTRTQQCLNLHMSAMNSRSSRMH